MDFNKQTPMTQESTTNNMMISRQAQEVQAAMIMANRFPRDQVIAYNRVINACKRPSLAAQAEYSYPRGGQKVNGASIRLVEAIAQNWGNVDCGIIELSNNPKQSELMAYAWDLETNTRITKTFTVEHKRDTKQGTKDLTDSRDIYENKANFGARRLRACILGIIPGDVVDAAIETCRETLKGSHKKPLIDRMRDMVNVFEDEFMVTKALIEDFLQFKIEACDENDFIRMRGVYKSLIDGMAKPEDYFKIKTPKKTHNSSSPLTDKKDDVEVEEPLTDEEKAQIKKEEAEEQSLPFDKE